MLSDLPIILYWWALVFGLGVVFLPLTWIFFRKFFDQGYAFSKILAILLVSYLVWFLGSLKIVFFAQETAWIVVVLLGFVIWKIKSFDFKNLIKENWKIFVFEEILFFVALVFWSYIRGFQPNIQGLEKFMDYGFVNSILRSRFSPPLDMWMSGETINYYYFGHLVTAVLTNLSGIDSAISYNLMMATIFALCFTAAFSLGANLVFLSNKEKKLIILGGVLSALLLALGGNLQPLWHFLKNKTFSGYWYPDATRFIVQKFGAADNTIHEFPLYSFVVADLHGHLLDLPFVLLFLALVLRLFQKRLTGLLDYCVTGLLLSVMFMTNAWDLPIYLLILGAVALCFKKNIWQTFKLCLLFFAFFIFFSLPFNLHFESIAQGISLVDFRSPFWMLLVLWGWPLVLTLTFFYLWRFKKLKIDYFVAILLFVSWLLILIPEIIYVKDIYIHEFQRANTVFKLTYQAFVMFSLVSGYIMVKFLTEIKRKITKILLFTFYLFIFTFIFIYPYFAIKSYYGLKRYQGLNGLKYLEALYPDDYQAILWLKKEIFGQPVVLEAVGESYTDFARVSANTGLPTVVGWPVHEWLWRGSYDEVGKRREEVRKIYEEGDKELLQKYKVEYLFLGDLERRQYDIDKEKLKGLGKSVFKSGATEVYRTSLK